MSINYAVRESVSLDFSPSVAKTLSYPSVFRRTVANRTLFWMASGWYDLNLNLSGQFFCVRSENSVLGQKHFTDR